MRILHVANSLGTQSCLLPGHLVNDYNLIPIFALRLELAPVYSIHQPLGSYFSSTFHVITLRVISVVFRSLVQQKSIKVQFYLSPQVDEVSKPCLPQSVLSPLTGGTVLASYTLSCGSVSVCDPSPSASALSLLRRSTSGLPVGPWGYLPPDASSPRPALRTCLSKLT